jgi:hypothetical protein
VICAACQQEREDMPAPEARVPLCRPCLQLLVERKQTECTNCGGMTLVVVGGWCVSCATDKRKLEWRGKPCKSKPEQAGGHD